MKIRSVVIFLLCIFISLSATGLSDACFSKINVSLQDRVWDDFYEDLENQLLDKISGKSCSVLNKPWSSIVMDEMESSSLKHLFKEIRQGKTVSVTYDEYTKPNCQGTFCPFSHCGIYLHVKRGKVQVMLLETKPIDRAPTTLHKKKLAFKTRLPK